MGALFENTNVNGILKIDVLKTDFEHAPAYPTYLYYNPFDESKTVDIYAGQDELDIYDCVSKTFAARNAKGTASIPIEDDGALLLVMVPAGGNITWWQL